MRKIVLFAIALFMFFVCNAITQATNDIADVVENIRDKVSITFDAIDNDMSRAAREIYPAAREGYDTRNVLSSLYKAHKNIVDCAFVDSEGVIAVVEPEAYKNFQGQDISRQEHVQRLHQTQKPLMSEAFLSVEGFRAVDIAYPVFKAGAFAGSLSMLCEPHIFLSGIITPLIKGDNIEVWVMQKDGMILYDRNAEGIGKNIFTDNDYQNFPQLLNLAKRISREREGQGNYTFWQDGFAKPVQKNACWATVDFHGTQWRIVVAAAQP
ncbi:MAG: cache domain-containing protein [Candidatus Omnitrophota bacterium]